MQDVKDELKQETIVMHILNNLFLVLSILISVNIQSYSENKTLISLLNISPELSQFEVYTTDTLTNALGLTIDDTIILNCNYTDDITILHELIHAYHLSYYPLLDTFNNKSIEYYTEYLSWNIILRDTLLAKYNATNYIEQHFTDKVDVGINRYIKSTLSDKVYCDILAYYNELKFNSYY